MKNSIRFDYIYICRVYEERKNTENTIKVVFEPEGKKVTVKAGSDLLEAASLVGASIMSECGGVGTCGKCRIIVKERAGLNDVTDAELKHLSSQELEKGYRLACCTVPIKDIVVEVPRESRLEGRRILVEGIQAPLDLEPLVKKYHIVLDEPTLDDVRADSTRIFSHFRERFGLENLQFASPQLISDLPRILRKESWRVTLTVWNNSKIIAVEPYTMSNIPYGVAVDIGTSKVITYLLNLVTGEPVAVEAVDNPQLIHGEDVMSRISYSMKSFDNLKELQSLIVNCINILVSKCCKRVDIDIKEVYEMTIVGNTAMHHFFLGIPTDQLGLLPYVPAVSEGIDIQAKELGLKVNPLANIHLLPIIAGFVGADAVGDILATSLYELEGESLLIDIGTNIEFALGGRDGFIVASSPGGPAFEGAHIRDGMKAVEGAIERIQIDPKTFDVRYSTIGGSSPRGICGSAMIDALAEMLRCGIINSNGAFNTDIASPRIRVCDGQPEFIIVSKEDIGLSKDIVITQKDVRELQLAKAAAYSGCKVLMKIRNLENKDIERIFIAGNFGNYLDFQNVKMIGLIPDIPLKEASFVGNAAGSGAKIALLSRRGREKTEQIKATARYVELAAYKDFQKEFLSATYLPPT